MRALLAAADIFVTSHRSGTLNKLGLDFGAVSEISPGIIQTDITGYPDARADPPGHDINYQAAAGLLVDKHLPTNLVADMHGGAGRATCEACDRRRCQGTEQSELLLPPP